MFEKNWFNVVLGLHALVLISAVYYRDYVEEAYKWTYQHFLGPGRAQEHFAYLAIIFMIAASIAAWVMFLSIAESYNWSSMNGRIT